MVRVGVRWLVVVVVLLLAGVLPVALSAQESDAGRVVVTSLDEDEQILPGTCWQAYGEDGILAGFNCDAYDGANDGTTVIGDLPPGEYLLVHYVTPPGHRYAKERRFTVTAGADKAMTVHIPRGNQTAFVTTLDEAGQPLPGACYIAYEDAGSNEPGPSRSGGCDFFDGANDGAAAIADLPAGEYVLVASYAPVGYGIPASQSFDVTDGQDAQLTVQWTPGGQRLRIVNVDDAGEPVLDTCVRLYLDAGSGERGPLVAVGCDQFDEVNGETVIEGVLPGRYLVVAPAASPGYELPPDHPVEIVEGKNKKVTVEHVLAEVTSEATPG